MNAEMLIVIAVVAAMFISLMLEITRPVFIVLTALITLLLTNIITTEEALRGFSNEGMLTIALLFIIAGVVGNNPLLYKFIYKMIGKSTSYRKTLIRMMIPISSLSAFFNNTPIVVMMIPIIRKWSKKHHVSASKFLIPLSYASIFGGMITLIGTATNLVVHGLMIDSGMEGFSMFQLATVTIPGAIIGILYITSVGTKLLPERKTLEDSFVKENKDYLTKAIVNSNSPLVGKRVREADLRGLFLVTILRGEEKITPVLPDEVIQAKDHLVFSGTISTILELQTMKGVEIATNPNLPSKHFDKNKLSLVEVVITSHSSLIHKTIKESNLRNLYDASVIALRSYQINPKEKIGDITLNAGDTLLLLVKEDIIDEWKNKFSNDFIVVSEIETPIKGNRLGFLFPIIVLALMIILASLKVVSMFKAAVIAIFIFLVTRIVLPNKILGYIDFQVLLLIASSFGIGIAIQKTGLADILATYVVQFGGQLGIIGILFSLYLITNVFTELITNTAAAVIMFPIALSISESLALDPMMFMIIIAVAASASFSTPIGYQTNLIVYSQGGYKYTDFLKVGLPLSFLYMVVTVTIVYFFVYH